MSDVERFEHGPDCACVRCTGFQPGHTLTLKHGAKAVLALKPRAAELAETLRAAVPVWSDSYWPALEAAAWTAARFEAAMTALDDATDPSELRWLDERARAWARLYVHLLGAMGLTPVAMAKRGVDLGRLATNDALRRHIEERYAGNGEAAS